ncbi:MAG: DUF4886 domain-containing protein [Oscillospiraceae bacterium]|nr:DUF4886 domain-containing protein [Oscillospiraceae bacterium]
MKKRILTALLALTMVMSCLAFPAAATDTAPKTLKILTIGNSYSIDVMAYLADIFKAEGDDTQLTLGNLYASGQAISGHWTYAKENRTYIYYKNTTGTWETMADCTIGAAVAEEDWDYIVFQQSGNGAGQPHSFNANLDNLIDYVNKYKTNPNTKLVWHMTWAVQKTHDSSAFLTTYNRDQYFYYECVANTLREQVITRPAFSSIIPVGTAIQNARATHIGDNLNRDGYHLNTLGRVIAGYTWYSMFTGKKLDTIRYTDVRAESATPAITLTAEDAQAVAQAVNAAIADPYSGIRPIYQLQAGDVFYIPYPPQANQLADAYVFGSDTVADGTKVIVQIPKDTVVEEENAYAAQFWYEDGGILHNVPSTDQCGGQFGLHDVITAIENNTITLDDGTHKGPTSCTLGHVGACGGETRSTTECAAQLSVSDKVTVTDLRAAVLNGSETAVTTVESVKALCDEGKAVVNTYAPNGTVQALVVFDHTLKITAEQPEGAALNVDTKDGWTDEDSVAYASIGFKASYSLPAGTEYKINQRQLDGQVTTDTSFFVKGNHTVSVTVKKIFQGDVFYFLDPPVQGQECEAIVLHSATLPLGISKVTPPNGKGSKYGAHHFWEIMDVESSPLKRLAGMWVGSTSHYRYGLHDIISIYDPEGNAITLATPANGHYSKATCSYSRSAGYDLPGYYEEKCGEHTQRGWECPSYLKLADDLKIYDLRGDVLAGLAPAAADVPTLKTLCDEGKALINTFTLDGTKSGGGTASAFIVIDAQPFMTRGEAVQALYEQAGKPAVTFEAKFTDVATDSEYANAVCWAAQTGLVSGYGDGSFGVNDNITVEQLAVMLWNKAGKAASSTTLSESITRSDWASSALNWCSETGVLEQVSFEKADFTATRTHIFQMLANSLNK